MKKLTATLAAALFVLTGCADPGPDYEALARDMSEVMGPDFTVAEAEVLAEAGCPLIAMGGRSAIVEVMTETVSFQDAARLAKSMDDNVCSRL